jgi:hypothetical protein
MWLESLETALVSTNDCEGYIIVAEILLLIVECYIAQPSTVCCSLIVCSAMAPENCGVDYSRPSSQDSSLDTIFTPNY